MPIASPFPVSPGSAIADTLLRAAGPGTSVVYAITGGHPQTVNARENLARARAELRQE